jgi:fatty acid desaturase
MATNEMKRQFEEIVAGLTADYPSLAGRRPRPRWLVVTAAIVGGVVWALLSVAMVAWGAIAVVTTCVVVAAAAAGILLDFFRWRRR